LDFAEKADELDESSQKRSDNISLSLTRIEAQESKRSPQSKKSIIADVQKEKPQ